MGWLKKNWLSVLLALIAAFSSGDIAVGLSSGKSLLNLSMLPSIVGLLGAAGFGGARWLNGATVAARKLPDGLDPEMLNHLESIFSVAAHPATTPEMVQELAGMASQAVIWHVQKSGSPLPSVPKVSE
jgi:hypothetical protein